MATDIPFKITVDTDIADLSVGELKQAFKQLTAELNQTQIGTEKYRDTLTKLGNVKGGLQDLKQQINALDPEKKFRAIAQIGSSVASGFAAAQGAVALFGGESEDLQKTLVKVQAATALATGLQGLQGMGKALQTAGLAMKAFALSNPFTAIAVGVVALVAAIGGLVGAYKDANSEVGKMQVAVGKLNKVYEEQKFLLNEELRLLQARKGSEEEAIIKKRELLVLGVKEIALSLALAEAKRREAIEQQTLLDIVTEMFSPALALSRRVQRIKEADDEVKIQKKKLAELKTDLTISFIDEKEIEKTKNDNKIKEAERVEKELEVIRKRIRGKIDEELVYASDKEEETFINTSETNRAFREQAEADSKSAEETRLRNEQKVADFRTMIQSESFKTIGELALAFAGKSEAAQKKAFQINKAAGIAQTTIDTYIAAQKAYASQIIVGDPSSIVRGAIAAGFSIAAGLARVAIIAKTQFNSNSAGGGDSPRSTSAPDLQSPQSQQNATSFSETTVKQNQQGNFAGFDKPIKAYVVESDMTSKQKTIKSIEEKTTF